MPAEVVGAARRGANLVAAAADSAATTAADMPRPYEWQRTCLRRRPGAGRCR